MRFLLALVPLPAPAAVDPPAAPLWAWCRPMIRLAPVLLMMAAVASGAAAALERSQRRGGAGYR